ncbi:MAG: sulfurtransferase TusA family protein [Deltaproteobacteria bacterium]|nr:sulfurtransferase TusA family protein [Deltaproteobacteria bacterium]
MSSTVDARGLSCPHPLLLTMKALADETGPITAIVDSESSAESLSSHLTKNKRVFSVTRNGRETTFQIEPKNS